MSALPKGSIAIAPGFRFQWEEVQQAYVILYPEGMIVLNPSAGEILKRCNGSRTMEAIVDDLQRQFPGDDLSADIRDFLEGAYERGWLESR
jgi:pyrroloquinoline quinone biosynthesis protein D